MNKTAILMTVYSKDSYNDFNQALNSLHSQSNNNFDIFIQEDGEIDPKIHQLLINNLKEKKIKFLGERSNNKGFDYSLNELITLTMNLNYKYFFRMDSDDISLPERVEKQLAFMDRNPLIDVCGTFITEFGDGFEYCKTVSYPVKHEDMFLFFKKRVPLAHVTALFRRSYFEKAGLYNVEGHLNNGDTLMWMKGFMSGCKFANLDIIGVKVRVSKNFFKRRGGSHKVISDFKNRLVVNKNLKYGLTSYFYAFLMIGINLLPPFLKIIAYKRLRR
tara:strand:+ start:52 stop:873 length:822 start_codon:yes stop_codon:yes gene_type:complete